MSRLIMVAAMGAMVAMPVMAEDIEVRMGGQAYAPSVIEARVGDTLVFINDDDTNHDVFIPTVGYATDLGRQEPQTEARMTLGQPGVFDVECVFHPHMTARVVVTP